ncbi:hypothetical protein Ahy_A10g047864 isoform L [Arachis hypogaea]|uniref:Uncharacterized protein n=1 Tax=Arachis hypogaea TaxID=3818 RepID=A0A445B3N0_ARAHY|nr:hypothetical protein Ahy_A10g047864 isoform L [Arachis hypogaea]
MAKPHMQKLRVVDSETGTKELEDAVFVRPKQQGKLPKRRLLKKSEGNRGRRIMRKDYTISLPSILFMEKKRVEREQEEKTLLMASIILYRTRISYFIKDAIPLSQQLEHYKECQNILVKVAGQSNASSIISGATHLVSAGNSDFIQNYYINPMLNKVYTADQFFEILMQYYFHWITDMHLYALNII